MDPGKITLASIVEAIEGMSVFNTCIMGFKECPFDEKCAMHQTWEETRDSIVKILKTTTGTEIITTNTNKMTHFFEIFFGKS